MPCDDWVLEDVVVYYLGYRPEIVYEAPYHNWCGVGEVGHQKIPPSKTGYPVLNHDFLKSLDWKVSSIIITGVDEFITHEPYEPPEGGPIVPLPEFSWDIPIPPPVYGGVNCDGVAGPAGPPGEPGPPGEDGEGVVTGEVIKQKLEESTPAVLRGIAEELDRGNQAEPEVLPVSFQSLTAAQLLLIAAQQAPQLRPLLRPLPEIQLTPNAVPTFELNTAVSPEKYVLTLPSEVQQLMQLVDETFTIMRCDPENGLVSEAVQMSIPMHGLKTMSPMYSIILELLNHLLRCCLPCQKGGEILHATVDESGQADCAFLHQLRVNVQIEDFPIDTTFASPDIKKYGSIRWVHEGGRMGELMFINSNNQIFRTEAGDVIGYAWHLQPGVVADIYVVQTADMIGGGF